MSDSSDDLLHDLGDLGAFVRAMRRGLKGGGPAVDEALLLGYIEATLQEDEHRQVRRAISTWRDWYQAYWELRTLVEASAWGGVPPAPGSPPLFPAAGGGIKVGKFPKDPQVFTDLILTYCGEPGGRRDSPLFARRLAAGHAHLFQFVAQRSKEFFCLELAQLVSTALLPDPPHDPGAFRAATALLGRANLVPDPDGPIPVEDLPKQFYRRLQSGHPDAELASLFMECWN